MSLVDSEIVSLIRILKFWKAMAFALVLATPRETGEKRSNGRRRGHTGAQMIWGSDHKEVQEDGWAIVGPVSTIVNSYDSIQLRQYCARSCMRSNTTVK